MPQFQLEASSNALQASICYAQFDSHDFVHKCRVHPPYLLVKVGDEEYGALTMATKPRTNTLLLVNLVLAFLTGTYLVLYNAKGQSAGSYGFHYPRLDLLHLSSYITYVIIGEDSFLL